MACINFVCIKFAVTEGFAKIVFVTSKEAIILILVEELRIVLIQN